MPGFSLSEEVAAHESQPRPAMRKRHRWGSPLRDVYLTTRTCSVCDLQKRTHHEGDGFPWITYHFRNGAAVSPMPECE